MGLIRRFEEEAGRQYQRAKAGGFLHLAIGEEATIVGTTSVMRDDDYLIGTYRTHGHAIARGTEPKRVMAELFGRVDGTSGGRGGSMHIFDGERRFMGGYGIVGGNLPIAAGLALASQYKGEDAVTVCMFGDGASNTGNFGETMNLAALWKLPVFFLVENNLYGMGTSVERHSAADRPLEEGRGLRDPRGADRRHGRDRGPRGRSPRGSGSPARSGGRPCSRPSPTATAATPPPTPRSTASARRSRSGAKKDPIETFAKRCIEAGVLGEREVQEVREKAEQAGHRGGRVRRRLAGTGARHALRKPLRARRAAAGTRSTSAARSRTAASTRKRRCPRPRASWPRRAPPTPGSPTAPRPNPAVHGDAQRGEPSPRSPASAAEERG